MQGLVRDCSGCQHAGPPPQRGGWGRAGSFVLWGAIGLLKHRGRRHLDLVDPLNPHHTVGKDWKAAVRRQGAASWRWQRQGMALSSSSLGVGASIQTAQHRPEVVPKARYGPLQQQFRGGRKHSHSPAQTRSSATHSSSSGLACKPVQDWLAHWHGLHGCRGLEWMQLTGAYAGVPARCC